MRVGFVGLGLIGSRRLRIARSLGAEIVFAVDPNTERAIEVTELGEHVSIVSDYRELSAEVASSADAVFVAVPHIASYQATMWALAAGSNVLCEKPLGIDSIQAAEIRDVAERDRAIVGVGFNYRYLPPIMQLHDAIARGELGEIIRARMLIGHGGRPGMEKEWKLSKELAGGGALIDPGIHLVDLCRHLFGEITGGAALLSKRFWDVDVEDNCVANLECGPVSISLDVSLTSWQNLFSIEVFGTEATAITRGRGGNYGSQVYEFTNRWFWAGSDQRRHCDFGSNDPSFELETDAFFKRCTSGERDGVLAGAEDAVSALGIVESLYAHAAW